MHTGWRWYAVITSVGLACIAAMGAAQYGGEALGLSRETAGWSSLGVLFAGGALLLTGRPRVIASTLVAAPFVGAAMTYAGELLGWNNHVTRLLAIGAAGVVIVQVLARWKAL